MDENISKIGSAGFDAGWNFDNSYARLPETFFVPTRPVPVSSPKIVLVNQALASTLGLSADALVGDEAAAFFAGNTIPPGAKPIAQAYAGHQFGRFTMLGDGRAVLLGEHLTPTGERLDIQFKGSGPTPFSRGGDGRAALGPMLREYIISEAMYALGISTTRSLAVVTTGEPVFRSTALPGAILTRVAKSHIRVGTFEYIASRNDAVGIKTLADYTLQRHFPSLAAVANPYLALLQAVMELQASLIAKWQMVGFIHGVMNTDNMAIAGETIDYGPCAFMDAYDPNTVFSSIDQRGRYAYANQQSIAQWNLARFAETLLPLIHPDHNQAVAMAQEALESFHSSLQSHWLMGMRRKLGMITKEEEDFVLIDSLLNLMKLHQADYTNTFRALAAPELPEDAFFHDAAFVHWHGTWQTRLARQAQPKEAVLRLMRSSSPAIIPRNHHVEEALEAAVVRSDFTLIQQLLSALACPYENQSIHGSYCMPAPPSAHGYQTFCGT